MKSKITRINHLSSNLHPLTSQTKFFPYTRLGVCQPVLKWPLGLYQLLVHLDKHYSNGTQYLHIAWRSL